MLVILLRIVKKHAYHTEAYLFLDINASHFGVRSVFLVLWEVVLKILDSNLGLKIDCYNLNIIKRFIA